MFCTGNALDSYLFIIKTSFMQIDRMQTTGVVKDKA